MNTENKASEIQVKDALDSIAVIRQVMDRSEVNMNRMGILFLLYGLLNLLNGVISGLFSRFYTGVRNLPLEELTKRVSISSIIHQSITWIIWAVLFVIFIRIRLQMKRSESKYTMYLFDMWGVTLFMPILINIFTPIALHLLSLSTVSVLICTMSFQMLHYGMKCMSMFVTGKLTNKWVMKLISFIMLLLVPVMCCADLSAIGVANESAMDKLGTLGVYSYISDRLGLATYVVIIIYIVMGIVFLVRNRREANGVTKHSGDVSVEAETDDNKCAD